MLENIYRRGVQNRQSRDIANIGYTRWRKTKQKRNSKYAGHPYAQTSIININKTLALLQTTGGKDVSSIVLCGNRNVHHNKELRT
jgi:hypothetical protein